MPRYLAMTALMLLALPISSIGCAKRNVFFENSERVIVLAKGETAAPPWSDGGVLMSKGNFSRLFEDAAEELIK